MGGSCSRFFCGEDTRTLSSASDTEYSGIAEISPQDCVDAIL